MTSRVAVALRQSVTEYHLFERGDSVAAAVSGGADSVALVHALRAIAAGYGLRIKVCHFNHRLRGAESDRDERFVRQLAERLELPCVVGSGDVSGYAAEHGLSTEEAGRELRYAFLRGCGCDKIATAHTLSDRAETLLFNMARGAGAKGMYPIPRRRGNIVRPLLDCTRADIEDYIAANKLEYVTDSTNADTAYSRNRIRHNVIPQLKEINPSFEQSAAGLMLRLEREHSLIERLADEAERRVADGEGYRRTGFLALDPVLGEELLLRLIGRAGAQPSARAVELMTGIARQGGGELELCRDMRFFCDGERLGLRGPSAPLDSPQEQKVELPAAGGELEFGFLSGKTVKITFLYNLEGNLTEKFNNGVLKNAVDCDKIKNTVLRGRLPGDRLTLAERGLTKTLKKLCNEAGMPPEQRARLAVLADAGGTIWAEGFGSDAARRPDAKTKRLMLIEVLEDEGR